MDFKEKKYVLELIWNNGDIEYEDDFKNEDDLISSVNVFYSACKKKTDFNGKVLVGFKTYINGKLDIDF